MTDLLARRFLPSPETIESRVGEETVILHLSNDTFYGLDPLGTHIWELIREGEPLAAIRDRLAAEYGIDPARVEGDVKRFIAVLLDQGLLIDA